MSMGAVKYGTYQTGNSIMIRAKVYAITAIPTPAVLRQDPSHPSSRCINFTKCSGELKSEPPYFPAGADPPAKKFQGYYTGSFLARPLHSVTPSPYPRPSEGNYAMPSAMGRFLFKRLFAAFVHRR
jgi:hypothetical protein